jgi:hypothetical protein
MRRDQSRRPVTFHNPGCEDAWILAIGRRDLALHGKLLPKACFARLSDGLCHAMPTQRPGHVLPRFELETTINKILRLRAAFLVRQIEQVILYLRLFDEQCIDLRGNAAEVPLFSLRQFNLRRFQRHSLGRLRPWMNSTS